MCAGFYHAGARIPSVFFSLLAWQASVRAKSWSSCRLVGCQNFRWMRSCAVFGLRYSYCCSLICAMSCVSSGRMLSLFCSMRRAR